MSVQFERRQNVIVALLLAGLCGVLGYSLSRGLGLEPWVWLLVIPAALGALLGVVGSHHPLPVVIALVTLTLLGFGALYLPLLSPWRSELRVGLDLLWASSGQGGPPPGMLAAETAATGLLLFLGGVPAGWLAGWCVWRRGWTLPLLLLGIVVLGAQWLWYVEAARPAMVAFWLLWLPLAGLVTAGARQAAWVRSGSRLARPPTERAILTSALLGLAVTFVALSIPSNFQPVNLDAVSRAVTEALPRLEGLRGASSAGVANRFSLARTGFARSQEKLGGPVRTDEREALRVRVTTPDPPSTLYLRGSVDTQYTGQGWVTPAAVKGDATVLPSPTHLVPEVPVPEQMVPLAQWTPGAKDMRKLPGTYAAISVTISSLRSSSLFAPVGALSITAAGGGVRRDLIGNLTTDRVLRRDQTYTEQVTAVITPSDILQKIPRAGSGSTDPAPYLALPSSLPPRVGALAREITAGAGNDFERALALETYLRGLRYTLDAPAPPAGRDFVDYFLFDLRSGYCAYSSTAMAVMLRTIGIPSRWAQGFAVPLDKGMGSYSVRNSEAHAWVEAYFQSYGWVLFDPTPRLTTPDRTALVLPQAAPGTAGDGGGDGTGSTVRPDRRPLLDDRETGDTPAGALSPLKRPPFPWGRVLLDFILAAAIFCLAALAALGAALWWRERLPAGGPQNQLRALFRNLEQMLGRFDHGRQPGQTPAEWVQAMRWGWPDLAGDLQLTLIAYEAARYGQQDPGTDAIVRTRALWNVLRRRVRQEVGLGRYVWGRLRLRRPGAAG
ncbi:MAG: transglutaminase domain-containing protein [Symbiobacteriia bacterium]